MNVDGRWVEGGWKARGMTPPSRRHAASVKGNDAGMLLAAGWREARRNERNVASNETIYTENNVIQPKETFNKNIKTV